MYRPAHSLKTENGTIKFKVSIFIEYLNSSFWLRKNVDASTGISLLTITKNGLLTIADIPKVRGMCLTIIDSKIHKDSHELPSACIQNLLFPHVLFVSGESVGIGSISINGLLPTTTTYITYDGSTTMPGCHETVTWILLNKPVYITKQQVRCISALQERVGRF